MSTEYKRVVEHLGKNTLHLEKYLNLQEIPLVPEKRSEFLQHIASLSNMISCMIENALTTWANDTNTGDGRWIKQNNAFPDVKYVDKNYNPQQHVEGIEVKCFYLYSDEPSSRFWEPCSSSNIQLYIVCWALSGGFHGHPIIVDSLLVDANSLAHHRNLWENLPLRVIEEPYDCADKKKNIQQTVIKTFTLQDDIEKVNQFMKKNEKLPKDILRTTLLQRYRYKQDSNPGKLNRIKYPPLQQFLKRVKKVQIANKKELITG